MTTNAEGASRPRMLKSKLLWSVLLVLAVHEFAFAAQFALILIIPTWPPSQAIGHFPFNLIDNLSGTVLLPYMYFRRSLPYSIFLVFGAEICLVYALLRLGQALRAAFRKDGNALLSRPR